MTTGALIASGGAAGGSDAITLNGFAGGDAGSVTVQITGATAVRNIQIASITAAGSSLFDTSGKFIATCTATAAQCETARRTTGPLCRRAPFALRA